MAYGSPLIDAHLHFWQVTDEHYAWVGDDLPASYLPPDHRRAFAGFDLAGGVHVEADRDNDRPWLETEWLAALAREMDWPLAIVAHADLTTADLDETLARHVQAGPVRGVRMRLAQAPADLLARSADDTLLTDQRWRGGFGRLAEHGLSFEMQATTNLIGAVAGLADAHPDTPIVLSHFAFPFDRSPQGIGQWRGALEQVGDHHNVWLKLSGLRMFDPAMPEAVVTDLVGEALDVFGADRLMFGSNFPVDTKACRPGAALDPLVGAIAALGQDSAGRILFDNARAFYRLGAGSNQDNLLRRNI